MTKIFFVILLVLAAGVAMCPNSSRSFFIFSFSAGSVKFNKLLRSALYGVGSPM